MLFSCLISLVSSHIFVRLKFLARCKKCGNFVLVALWLVCGSRTEHSYALPVFICFLYQIYVTDRNFQK